MRARLLTASLLLATVAAAPAEEFYKVWVNSPAGLNYHSLQGFDANLGTLTRVDVKLYARSGMDMAVETLDGSPSRTYPFRLLNNGYASLMGDSFFADGIMSASNKKVAVRGAGGIGLLSQTMTKSLIDRTFVPGDFAFEDFKATWVQFGVDAYQWADVASMNHPVEYHYYNTGAWMNYTLVITYTYEPSGGEIPGG